jgi:hypothetical protein
MKMKCATLAIVALAAAVPVAAQPAPPGQTTLATALQRGYNNIKMNLTQSADKLSDADYGFKVGTMAETRTFGQLFGHVANSQFGTCAAAKGVANPNMGNNLEQTAKTKADVVKALAASFAFCDDAFSSLTDATALQMIKQGQGEIVRAAALANLIAHSNEMRHERGYLRRGVVPPSTERQTMSRGGR